MKALALPWIAKLDVYEPGKPIEEVAREHGFRSVRDIVKLASNENPLGPSPRALRAMRRAADAMHRYPDSGAHRLRQALADKLRVSPDELLIANGANEIIEFIGHVFLGPGVEQVVSDRAFAIYRLVGDLFRAKTRSVPMRGFTHDLEAMLAAVTPRTRVVYVANPNNPTGTMVDAADLDRFVRAVPDSAVVALDEAYVELLPPRLQPDTLRYVREGRPVIVLRTFSKTYGLAGLRVGYAVAPPPLIRLMHRVRQAFNFSAMALAAAEAALGDDAFVRRTRQVIEAGRRLFERRLPALGLPYVPSVANFMLVETGRARATFLEMQKRKVIVRPMDGYGLPDHVRVTLGTREENERCLKALAAVARGGTRA